ncbi:acyl-CoA dehydratase activase [Chloroflexota bacterium]
MIFAGIDIGSVTTKAVLLSEKEAILAFAMAPTSFDRNQSGEAVLELALQQSGKPRSEIGFTIATGYGRRSFNAVDKVTPEIICHAKGTHFLIPDAKTIIDIGGQDSKIIEMSTDGMVVKFEMNDKCAAGTGRFLEVLTERILNTPLEDLGPLSLKANNPCTLSSVCTVFAETEIISLLSEKKAKEDIAYGMHLAIAKRVISMGSGAQIRYEEPIVFTGGVARNIGVAKAIEEVLAKEIIIPEQPQITAALGAALAAKDNK